MRGKREIERKERTEVERGGKEKERGRGEIVRWKEREERERKHEGRR